MQDHLSNFQSAARAAGLEIPDILHDGKIHRFSTNGKRADTAGWCVFYGGDRAAGIAGCWRSGVQITWRSVDESSVRTVEERAAWAERMEQIREAERTEREQRHARAAEAAAQLWDLSAPLDHAVGYIEKKFRGDPAVTLECLSTARQSQGCVIVPVYGGAGKLVGAQRIDADGTKRFIVGTPISGGSYSKIGKLSRDTKTVVVCEGWATGVSIHAATQIPVVVAFNAANLTAAAQRVRSVLPDAEIILAADDDIFTDGNPGVTAAKQAAKALKKSVIILTPRWAEDRPVGSVDFNDLHVDEGIQAVRDCFDFSGSDDDNDGGGSDQPAQDNAASVLTGSQQEPVNNTASAGAVYNSLAAACAATNQGVAELTTAPAAPVATELVPVNELLIHASTPANTSDEFAARLPAGGRIVFWRDEFHVWSGTHYRTAERVEIEQQIYKFTRQCKTLKETKLGTEVVPFNPRASHVNDICHALRASCWRDIPSSGSWIESEPGDPCAGDVIAVQNGFLDSRTRALTPSTDRLFVQNALPLEYDPSAGRPEQWIRFLEQTFPGDQQAIDTLQEIMGYLLTGDTSQQKAFLFIGPPRSGKGTILRVIESLVGEANRVSPSLESVGNQFGLQPLIGKRVALISDARLSGKADQAPIVENILRITGEDAVTIDRKRIDAWTGKLQTRFVMATNEFPNFTDASAALANRFILLQTTISHLGREDPGLTGRLLSELNSILTWALDGLDRLRARGHFVQPASSAEMIEAVIESTSPVGAFAEQYLDVVADGYCQDFQQYRASRDEVYALWKLWCKREGRDHVGTKIGLGRSLKAALPAIRRTRVGGVNGYQGVRVKPEWQAEAQRILDEMEGRSSRYAY